jgi:hypothetical protein
VESAVERRYPTGEVTASRETGQKGNRENEGRALLGADQTSHQQTDQENGPRDKGAGGGSDHHGRDAEYAKHQASPGRSIAFDRVTGSRAIRAGD